MIVWFNTEKENINAPNGESFRLKVSNVASSLKELLFPL
jgi:hypothetical protein